MSALDPGFDGALPAPDRRAPPPSEAVRRATRATRWSGLHVIASLAIASLALPSGREEQRRLGALLDAELSEQGAARWRPRLAPRRSFGGPSGRAHAARALLRRARPRRAARPTARHRPHGARAPPPCDGGRLAGAPQRHARRAPRPAGRHPRPRRPGAGRGRRGWGRGRGGGGGDARDRPRHLPRLRARLGRRGGREHRHGHGRRAAGAARIGLPAPRGRGGP